MEKRFKTNSAPIRFRDLGTREGFIAAIKDCGVFIIDHAEGILGEYPGAILENMSITAEFTFDSLPSITVRRDHIVTPCYIDEPDER